MFTQIVSLFVFLTLFYSAQAQPQTQQGRALSRNVNRESHLQKAVKFVPDEVLNDDDEIEEDMDKVLAANQPLANPAYKQLRGPAKPRIAHNTGPVVPPPIRRPILSRQLTRQRSGPIPAQKPVPKKTKTRPTPTAPQTQHASRLGHADEEEAKLKTASNKLVKWLRNRLAKRVGEATDLTSSIKGQGELIETLKEAVQSTSGEREKDIRVKIERLKKLREYKKLSSKPMKELQAAQHESDNLSTELSHLQKRYDFLTVERERLKDRLEHSGLGHWLEVNGKEHLPATAVGVLSKSAQILDPLSRGAHEVIEMDKFISTMVENLLPTSESRMISKVVWDLVMLAPVIPMIIAFWWVNDALHEMSAYHAIFGSALVLTVTTLVHILASVIVGGEALSLMQQRNEVGCICFIMVISALLVSMIILQTMVTAVDSSSSDVSELLVTLTISFHWYLNVFQPAMVSLPIRMHVIEHILYLGGACFVGYKKKEKIKLQTGFDESLERFVEYMQDWLEETGEAVRNIFSDENRDYKGGRWEIGEEMKDGSVAEDTEDNTEDNKLGKEIIPSERFDQSDDRFGKQKGGEAKKDHMQQITRTLGSTGEPAWRQRWRASIWNSVRNSGRAGVTGANVRGIGALTGNNVGGGGGFGGWKRRREVSDVDASYNSCKEE